MQVAAFPTFSQFRKYPYHHKYRRDFEADPYCVSWSPVTAWDSRGCHSRL